MRFPGHIIRVVVLSLAVNAQGAVRAKDTFFRVSTPMAPPAWALLERELLRANAEACRVFFDKYFDERGFLQCVERWGGDDGPDDAIECCNDWPLVHALGGSEDVLEMFVLAWEGHLRQYTAARTVDVPLARGGMYYKEFPVTFDWVHNGEGLRAFSQLGLSKPMERVFRDRMIRYAGFYLNEDAGAQNYDSQHKIIRSLFNGSRGPLLRKATALDWAGDPIQIEGRFQPKHGEENYQQMLEHFQDYNDIVGDHPQNLCATSLALYAFMLTGEDKYRRWTLEYVDAWAKRTRKNGNVIPTNIGLDGVIGSAANGKWYGGTYGWAFSVKVPQSGEMAHRNTHQLGLAGFGNAHLLTGEDGYLQVWRDMTDVINSHRKEIKGAMHYPTMYGDQGWYAYRPGRYAHGARDIWYWSMLSRDRLRMAGDGWVQFLEGKNPTYPENALRGELSRIRDRVASLRADMTTRDTRLADDPLPFNPASAAALVQLTMGGLPPGAYATPLYCRFRYFDPVRRRAGLPLDVAALVTKMDADESELTLVNLNQLQRREIVIQGGAYREHRLRSITFGDTPKTITNATLGLILEPGCGATLTIAHDCYASPPTLRHPWN